MAKFTGDYKEVFELSVTPEVAKAHFSHVETIAANYGPVESWEKLDDERLHFVLKEQKAKGESFTPDFVARYHFTEPDTLVWETEEGNMISQGRAIFSGTASGGTQVDYQGTIEMELPLGRILSKIISPIAGKLMKNGIRDYVDRMKKAVPSS